MLALVLFGALGSVSRASAAPPPAGPVTPTAPLASGGADSDSVVVTGDADCASAPAVGAALLGLLPPRPEGERPDTLNLHQGADGISVRLTDGFGALIAEKRLPDSTPCHDRAQTVAAMVAAWEAHFRPGPPTPLPRTRGQTQSEGPSASDQPLPPSATIPAPASASAPAAPPPPSPRSRSRTAPASVPASAAPPPPPPSPRSRPPTAARSSRQSGSPPEDRIFGLDDGPSAVPVQIETRAGLLMSMAGGTFAPGVTGDVSFGRADSRFALAAGAIAVGTHDTTVGPGAAGWRRVGGLIDLRSEFPGAAFDLEMHAGAAFTAVSVSGASLPLTSGATLFDPGLLVGLRSRFHLRRVAPWIEATAALWPMAHSLYVTGAEATRELPSLEVLLGLGLSFGRSHDHQGDASSDED